MSHLPPPTRCIQSAEQICQDPLSCESQYSRYTPGLSLSICEFIRPAYYSLRSTSIHILNDDTLLNIFYLNLPIDLPVDEDFNHSINDWESYQERRWYKLAHVCQRWRSLILASASYLRHCLFCTYCTPVAQMLAHSPSLPLVIDYFDEDDDVTTEDEEGILLALQHRDRVRSIRLQMPVPSLQILTMAMSDEFGTLECLVITPPTKEDTSLVHPKTFQAPRLRHLLLMIPIGSPLLTTAQAVNLVSLCLGNILQSENFHPNYLLQPLLHIARDTLDSLPLSYSQPRC